MSTHDGDRIGQSGSEDRPHFAALIDEASSNELKLGLLRAIDHARKTSAEIAVYKALLDDARVRISELSKENRELQDRLKQLSHPPT